MPAEFKLTVHGMKFWQDYERDVLQARMQKAKAEASSPLIRELIRLTGVFLTPYIPPMTPSAIEPLSSTGSENPKTGKVNFSTHEVMCNV